MLGTRAPSFLVSIDRVARCSDLAGAVVSVLAGLLRRPDYVLVLGQARLFVIMACGPRACACGRVSAILLGRPHRSAEAIGGGLVGVHKPSLDKAATSRLQKARREVVR